MLSDELKQIYTYQSKTRSYDTIYLSHSGFSQDWYFVQDNISHNWKLSSGTTKTFIPLGFDIVLPTIGSAQQDMTITMDNTNLQLVKELNLATSNISEPILLTHNVYIDGDDEVQSSDIVLSLRNIKISKEQLSGTASSVDTIGKPFLTEKFDSRFKGLFL